VFLLDQGCQQLAKQTRHEGSQQYICQVHPHAQQCALAVTCCDVPGKETSFSIQTIHADSCCW
jgi:hypothetical protein